VHDGTTIRILFRLSQDLVSDRRRIAFAERDVLHEIGNRVAFTPAKINVRQLSGLISQKSRNAAIAFGTAGDSVRKT
jgi:hypothetical protein